MQCLAYTDVGGEQAEHAGLSRITETRYGRRSQEELGHGNAKKAKGIASRLRNAFIRKSGALRRYVSQQ